MYLGWTKPKIPSHPAVNYHFPCLPEHFSLYLDEFPVHILPSLPSAPRTTSDKFAATRNPPIPLPAHGLTLQNLIGSTQEQNTATDSSTTPVDLVESESTWVPRTPRAGNNFQPLPSSMEFLNEFLTQNPPPNHSMHTKRPRPRCCLMTMHLRTHPINIKLVYKEVKRRTVKAVLVLYKGG